MNVYPMRNLASIATSPVEIGVGNWNGNGHGTVALSPGFISSAFILSVVNPAPGCSGSVSAYMALPLLSRTFDIWQKNFTFSIGSGPFIRYDEWSRERVAWIQWLILHNRNARHHRDPSTGDSEDCRQENGNFPRNV